MVTGASGGKTDGSNVIVSPFCASSIAWRSVPGPLSSALVTSRVLPWGAGGGVAGSCIGVGDASVRVGATVVAVGCSSVCVGISGAAVGVSLGIQAESASITAIMRGKIAFFIISLTYKRHHLRYQHVQPLIDQAQDDRIILDQEVTDDQVPVLHLENQFLLEAVEHVNADHFLGGHAGERDSGWDAGVVINCDIVIPHGE